jgi:hypothetical protein
VSGDSPCQTFGATTPRPIDPTILPSSRRSPSALPRALKRQLDFPPILFHRRSDRNQEEVKVDDRTHKLVDDLQVDLEIVALELRILLPDIVRRYIFRGTVSARQHSSPEGSVLQVSVWYGIVLYGAEDVKVEVKDKA